MIQNQVIQLAKQENLEVGDVTGIMGDAYQLRNASILERLATHDGWWVPHPRHRKRLFIVDHFLASASRV